MTLARAVPHLPARILADNSQVLTHLISAGLDLAAGLAGRRSLLIVTYHRVLPEPDPYLPSEPDQRAFAVQVGFLARHCNVMALHDALQLLGEDRLPRRAVAVTLDDGYANNLHNALPVLRSLGVPATVFVATGYLDGGSMWNDVIIEALRRTPRPTLDLGSLSLGNHATGDIAARRVAIRDLLARLKYQPPAQRNASAAEVARQAEVVPPRNLMLRSDEVRILHRAGIEIGGHTVNHPILAAVPEDEAEWEISEGAARIAAITGSRPRVFAYPNGRPGADFGPEHARMVRRAGFSHALTTERGLARQGTDPYLIPRVTLWGRTNARLAGNLVSLYAGSRQARRRD